jgi:hypothetical protein
MAMDKIEMEKTRLTVSLDPARDLPLTTALSAYPQEKRAGLLRTFAMLGCVIYRMAENGDQGLPSPAPGRSPEKALEDLSTPLCLKGAIS